MSYIEIILDPLEGVSQLTIASKGYLPLLKRKEFKELGRILKRKDIEKIRKEMDLSEGFTDDFLNKRIIQMFCRRRSGWIRFINQNTPQPLHL